MIIEESMNILQMKRKGGREGTRIVPPKANDETYNSPMNMIDSDPTNAQVQCPKFIMKHKQLVEDPT